MKVYFISGLAADSRIFKHIRLPNSYEIVHLNWISPQKNESLGHYALRLAEKIDTTEPFALVGLSMGGMIASEIAMKFKPVATILISSAPCYQHLPPQLKMAYYLRLYKWVPISLLKKISIYKRALAPDSEEDKMTMKQVIKESDPAIIRWALYAILSWRNETIPTPIWHIHGTKDEIIPIRYTHPTHRILNANHLMVMSRAAEINEFIKEVLVDVNQH
jgi:pimeloyl-ACP methyl ester carboxylesterase